MKILDFPSSKLNGIILAAGFGAFAGSMVAAALIFGTSDPVTLLSSLATLGAAIAAFLTVREMQAARREGARARIGFRGANQPIRFSWSRADNRIVQLDGPSRIEFGNATAGTAEAVRVQWSAAIKISAADIEAINSMIGSDGSLQVGSSGYEATLRSADGAQLSLPIAGADSSIVGDVGPGQDLEVEVPAVVVNYISIKWIALVTQTLKGKAIAPADVARFELKFTHDNPYQKDISDFCELRFVMAKFVAKDASGRDVTILPPESVYFIEATLIPELWSKKLSSSIAVVI